MEIKKVKSKMSRLTNQNKRKYRMNQSEYEAKACDRWTKARENMNCRNRCQAQENMYCCKAWGNMEPVPRAGKYVTGAKRRKTWTDTKNGKTRTDAKGRKSLDFLLVLLMIRWNKDRVFWLVTPIRQSPITNFSKNLAQSKKCKIAHFLSIRLTKNNLHSAANFVTKV